MEGLNNINIGPHRASTPTENLSSRGTQQGLCAAPYMSIKQLNACSHLKLPGETSLHLTWDSLGPSQRAAVYTNTAAPASDQLWKTSGEKILLQKPRENLVSRYYLLKCLVRAGGVKQEAPSQQLGSLAVIELASHHAQVSLTCLKAMPPLFRAACLV